LNSSLTGGGVASTGAVFFCASAKGLTEVNTRQKQSAATIKCVGLRGNIAGNFQSQKVPAMGDFRQRRPKRYKIDLSDVNVNKYAEAVR
jgi:hypothetical protein